MPNLRGRPTRLTPEERKSLTHGDFWIPDDEREIYRRALEAVTAADLPYVVAGAHPVFENTGLYPQTKKIDLFFFPPPPRAPAPAPGGAGVATRLGDSPSLGQARMGVGV